MINENKSNEQLIEDVASSHVLIGNVMAAMSALKEAHTLTEEFSLKEEKELIEPMLEALSNVGISLTLMANTRIIEAIEKTKQAIKETVQ